MHVNVAPLYLQTLNWVVTFYNIWIIVANLNMCRMKLLKIPGHLYCQLLNWSWLHLEVCMRVKQCIGTTCYTERIMQTSVHFDAKLWVELEFYVEMDEILLAMSSSDSPSSLPCFVTSVELQLSLQVVVWGKVLSLFINNWGGVVESKPPTSVCSFTCWAGGNLNVLAKLRVFRLPELLVVPWDSAARTLVENPSLLSVLAPKVGVVGKISSFTVIPLNVAYWLWGVGFAIICGLRLEWMVPLESSVSEVAWEKGGAEVGLLFLQESQHNLWYAGIEQYRAKISNWQKTDLSPRHGSSVDWIKTKLVGFFKKEITFYLVVKFYFTKKWFTYLVENNNAAFNWSCIHIYIYETRQVVEKQTARFISS